MTGGPAFPRPAFAPAGVSCEDCEINCSQDGMSFRDYLAAHAPDRPLWDFEPAMPIERPEPRWAEGQCRGDSDPINYKEIRLWDMERNKQLHVQWRWAYADAVMGAY